MHAILTTKPELSRHGITASQVLVPLHHAVKDRVITARDLRCFQVAVEMLSQYLLCEAFFHDAGKAPSQDDLMTHVCLTEVLREHSWRFDGIPTTPQHLASLRTTLSSLLDGGRPRVEDIQATLDFFSVLSGALLSSLVTR